MIINSPLCGDINIPDTAEAIMAELSKTVDLIKWKYSMELQIYIDALNEGLDKLQYERGDNGAI